MLEQMRWRRYGLGAIVPGGACYEPFSSAALASLAATAGTTGATAAVGTSAITAGSTLAPLTLAGVQSAVGIGSAGGSLLSAFGGMSTVTSILSGVATVGSMMNTQRAGDVAAMSYELNAQDAETSAKIEGNQEIDRRTSLKAALVKAIGERDVATAASGADLSFGTPAIARREAIADTERAIATSGQTSNLRQSRLLERAASYRTMALNTQYGALAKAAGTGLTGLAGIVARG